MVRRVPFACLAFLPLLGCGGSDPTDAPATAATAAAPALGSPDAVERMAAAKRAGTAGAAARELLPQLERIAKEDPDGDVRRVAAGALRSIRVATAPAGGGDAAPLLEQLRHADAFVRLQAAKKAGLLAQPSSAVFRTLVAVATEDPDEDVRAVAKRSWNQLNGTGAAGLAAGEERPKAMATLRALDGREAVHRREALETLLQRDPDDPERARGRTLFGDLLREALISDDPAFQTAVRRAAARIEVIARDDPDEDTRLTARQLVAAIRDYEKLGGVLTRAATPAAPPAAPLAETGSREPQQRRGGRPQPQPAEPAPPAEPPPARPTPEPAAPPAPQHSIVGSWTGTANAHGMLLTLTFRFRQDGTFLLESFSPAGMQTAMNGTYTYQDGAVTTTPAGGGQVERASVDWIDPDSFTYFGGGFKIRFARAR